MKEMDSQSKTSLKLQAYQYLKTKILNCEYRPNEFLNEQKLCAEMGNISRTPMRDALGRLEQEGLITILPKKGLMVSGITEEDVHSMFEMRLLVEPYALRTYGNLIPREQLENRDSDPPACEVKTGTSDPRTTFCRPGIFRSLLICRKNKNPEHFLCPRFLFFYSNNCELICLLLNNSISAASIRPVVNAYDFGSTKLFMNVLTFCKSYRFTISAISSASFSESPFSRYLSITLFGISFTVSSLTTSYNAFSFAFPDKLLLL